MKANKLKAVQPAKGTERRGGASAEKNTGEPRPTLLDRYPKFVALTLITLFAAFLHSQLIPLVADADSFYHLRHTWIYRTRGIFDSSFPWAQFSVVKTNAADIWYGFHILILPFSYFDPLLDGIYWGAFIITIASLWLVFMSFLKLEVRWPLLWTFFVPLMSSDLMYRLTMMRPHPLTLGLVMLLFAYLVKPTSRSTLPAIFIVGAVMSWLHLALAWMPVFIAAVATLVRLFHKRLPEFTRLAALGAGLAVGIMLRPHPLGALNVAYVQIVELMVAKRQNLPLQFGIELWPFYAINFYDQSIPLSILLPLAIGAVVVLIRNRQFTAIPSDLRIAIWASLATALTFFGLSFEVARRSHEIFVGFSAIFIALLVTQWRWTTKEPTLIRLAAGIAVVTFIAGASWNLYRYPQLAAASSAPRRYQEAGEWLAQHAKPGEIVFHPWWDRFGDLFLWNPNNYYINGMDPIFEYAYDRQLYWKSYYLYNGAADEVTCSAYPCVDEVIRTYDSLKQDFYASYVAIEPDIHPGLDQYLSRTPRVTKMFESTTGVTIYKID